ncbi:MAG: glycosyltransferase [Bacteroidetes bacterium]|nr:glycosyltransferase [Bacteroidota bacterium]
MNFLVNKNILIISPEAWTHLSVSKHHYAKVLAENGNRVYFLNPPSNYARIEEDQICKDIFVVDYISLPGVNRLPSFFRNYLNRHKIKSIRNLCNVSFDIVWSFDAFRFQNLKLFNCQFTIYHAVDIHVSNLEGELAQSCDLILAVSQRILDRFESYDKPKKKINHGLASYFFEPQGEAPLAKNTFHIGYVGNLDNWCIDIGTLLTIVSVNPEVNFTFIGPYKDDSVLASSLKSKHNCTLLGRVSAEKLPEYFEQFHFFLMCYNGEEVDVNSNHHKILEYLTTGKPVVMNYTDEFLPKACCSHRWNDCGFNEIESWLDFF